MTTLALPDYRQQATVRSSITEQLLGRDTKPSLSELYAIISQSSLGSDALEAILEDMIAEARQVCELTRIRSPLLRKYVRVLHHLEDRDLRLLRPLLHSTRRSLTTLGVLQEEYDRTNATDDKAHRYLLSLTEALEELKRIKTPLTLKAY